MLLFTDRFWTLGSRISKFDKNNFSLCWGPCQKLKVTFPPKMPPNIVSLLVKCSTLIGCCEIFLASDWLFYTLGGLFLRAEKSTYSDVLD